MNGTDRCDNFLHRSDFSMLYRTKLFWKRRFLLRLFTICLVNAFLKFNEFQSPELQITYTEYRFRLSFYFIMVKNTDFQFILFTFHDNRTNGRVPCQFCSEFSSPGTRTEQKCAFCQAHSCPSHSETLCFSCCTDLKHNAILPFTPRIYTAR